MQIMPSETDVVPWDGIRLGPIVSLNGVMLRAPTMLITTHTVVNNLFLISEPLQVIQILTFFPDFNKRSYQRTLIDNIIRHWSISLVPKVGVLILSWTDENAKGNIKPESFHKTNIISTLLRCKEQIVKARMCGGH